MPGPFTPSHPRAGFRGDAPGAHAVEVGQTRAAREPRAGPGPGGDGGREEEAQLGAEA